MQLYFLNNETGRLLRDRIDHTVELDFLWSDLLNLTQGYAHISHDYSGVGASAEVAELDIKVLGSTGLQTVLNERDWRRSVEDAMSAVWLEGVVKVLVHVAPLS